MIIGVFDSGRGGELLAKELQEAFSDHTIITELDIENVPYGLKSPDEIYELTKAGLNRLTDRGADILVLACNTASTIIHRLRGDYTQQIIGLEPMIKPAAEATATGVVAVFATPATLASTSYKNLKNRCATDCTVLEPDCGTWSTMIQRDSIDWNQIETTVQQMLDQRADVLVLGCTHYHILEDNLVKMVGDKVIIMQPSKAIIAQIRTLISNHSIPVML